MNPVSQLLDDLSRLPKPGPAEQRKLILKAQAGCVVSRNRVVEANMGLVVSYSKKKSGWNVPQEDLVSEGALGLMRAVMKFNVDRGIQFSTYARYWIARQVLNFLKERYLVWVPAYAQNEYWKLHNGDDTTLTPRQAHNVHMAGVIIKGILMDDPVAYEGSRLISLMSGVADKRPSADLVEQQESEEETAQWLEQSKRMMACLNARDQSVMSMRFGLDGSAPLNYVVIGERLGISRECAWQVVATAIKRIRKMLEKQHADAEAR